MIVTFNISGTINLSPSDSVDKILSSLTMKLAQSDQLLASAVASTGKPTPHGDSLMTTLAKTRLGDPTGNPIIDGLITQVNTDQTVIGSATTLINGISAQITAAVNAALDGGATAAQLAPLTDLTTSLGTADQALAQAVANNTPTTPVTPVSPPTDPTNPIPSIKTKK